MRSRLLFAALAAVLVACGSAVRVNTSVAPNANFSSLRAFRVMSPPARRDNRSIPAEHPMLDNSIINRSLRADLVSAFQARGYGLDPTDPDFTVAYYASTREKLDVTAWDYGYPGRWGGWRARTEYEVRPFTEGTVIVDVVDARTRDLLWRGQGVSVVSDDPETYMKNIRSTVTAIVEKFPHSATRLSQ
jgi:uncharacterized protein DUF4136